MAHTRFPITFAFSGIQSVFTLTTAWRRLHMDVFTALANFIQFQRRCDSIAPSSTDSQPRLTAEFEESFEGSCALLHCRRCRLQKSSPVALRQSVVFVSLKPDEFLQRIIHAIILKDAHATDAFGIQKELDSCPG